MDPATTIKADGSNYAGGAGNFTLIDSAAFTETPVITLTNFALGATYVWNTNNGNFTVHVGNQAPVAQNFAVNVPVGGSVTLEAVGKYASDADGDPLTILATAGAANGTVSIVDNTNLVYTSTNDAAGDSFTYTVSDGKGGTDTKTVTVSTYSPQGFNKLFGPTLVSPGLYQLDYLGVPGQKYALDESPDLVSPYTWTPVVTNTAGEAGAINYTVPLSYPSGSFRTRHVPGGAWKSNGTPITPVAHEKDPPHWNNAGCGAECSGGYLHHQLDGEREHPGQQPQRLGEQPDGEHHAGGNAKRRGGEY